MFCSFVCGFGFRPPRLLRRLLPLFHILIGPRLRDPPDRDATFPRIYMCVCNNALVQSPQSSTKV